MHHHQDARIRDLAISSRCNIKIKCTKVHFASLIEIAWSAFFKKCTTDIRCTYMQCVSFRNFARADTIRHIDIHGQMLMKLVSWRLLLLKFWNDSVPWFSILVRYVCSGFFISLNVMRKQSAYQKVHYCKEMFCIYTAYAVFDFFRNRCKNICFE